MTITGSTSRDIRGWGVSRSNNLIWVFEMIKAHLIEHKNDDNLIVDAARASFSKTSDQYTSEQNERLIRYLARHNHWTPFSHVRITIPVDLDLYKLTETDVAGMVWNEYGMVRTSFHGWANIFEKHLAERCIYDIAATLNHYCPVSYDAYYLPCIQPDDYSVQVNDPRLIDETFLYEVPIFVARQEFKHMIGFTRNERSGRYVTAEPEIYTPDVWRAKPDGSIKQGSGGASGISDYISEDIYPRLMAESTDAYDWILSRNIAPEMARMVLPQSMMTSYYVTGSLAAYRRMVDQRKDPTAQKEIQLLADIVDEKLTAKYGSKWGL